jgi:uncharacterized SAM-binding protein YcdF (DUF218 family)
VIATATKRALFWTAVIAMVVVATAVASIVHNIVHDSCQEELHPADAIVVFGAAEYVGHPSPVFRARLDHALELFHKGLAPAIITTGGAAADPKFNEGGVGREYLIRKGVPEAAVIAETEASDTAQSAERVATIMRANHMRSCLAVSDAYHVFRVRKLLEHEGVQVYVAPRPDSRPKTVWKRGAALLRESVSYLVWRAGMKS